MSFWKERQQDLETQERYIQFTRSSQKVSENDKIHKAIPQNYRSSKQGRQRRLSDMCSYVQIGKGDSGKHLSWILLEAAVGISVMSWSSKCPCFWKYPLTHTPLSNPSNLTGYQSGLQCNHYFHLFLVPISFLFLGE